MSLGLKKRARPARLTFGRLTFLVCLVVQIFYPPFSQAVVAAITAIGDLTPAYPVAAPDPWVLGADLTIAVRVDGSLTIDGGSVVESTSGSLGFSFATEGRVEVIGNGSRWNVDNNVFLGVAGDGVMQILAGGVVANTSISVGHISGEGDVLVNGMGSQLLNSEDLFVGNGSQGTITIDQGGRVESENSWLGFNTGATGIVDIMGTQSVLSISKLLSLGNSFATGSGTLSLLGNGNRVYLGDAAEAFGNALPNSEVALIVSDAAGEAELALFNSSVLNNQGNAYVGTQSAGAGSVRINGPLASWNNTGELFLGNGGQGTLVLENGGSAEAAGGITIGNSGMISGDGAVTGNIINAGILSPGQSIGSISLQGDYEQASQGIFEVDLAAAAANQFDTLIISGQAILGGTLDVEFSGMFAPVLGDRFEVLIAANGVNGSFNVHVLPILPNDQIWQVRYELDRVALVVSLPGDFNADGVVDGLDLSQWEDDFGLNSESDANTDCDSDGGDFLVWQRNFGSQFSPVESADLTLVPEPCTSLFALLGLLRFACRCRR